MSSEELKPCPFCGGKAERFTLQDEENFGGYVIVCTKCDACSRIVFGEKEGLNEAWNTRAQLAAIQGGMGEVVEVVAWRHFGDASRLLCDLGKQRSVPGDYAAEFNIPLMTVAQHQRITAAMAAEVERLSRMLNNATNDGIKLADERDALAADLEAIKRQEVVDCKVVPVDLIERTICRLTHGHEHDKAVRELRALLAGAEGVKDE